MKTGSIVLLRAYRDYSEHDNNPNSSNSLYEILLSTNKVAINNTQYQCVILMHSDTLYGSGTLFMTTNRTFIFLDSKGRSKIIDPTSKPPNFW